MVHDSEDFAQAVERYNRNVAAVPNANNILHVEHDAVAKYVAQELASRGDGGLWRSLVYDPWDMSVYVRTCIRGENGNELDVDVALCTQDFTWRSNHRLENLQKCGDAVGNRDHIESVPALDQLSRIVQHVAGHRFVHAVRRYGNQVTVDLATRYIEGRDNAASMDVQFSENCRLRTDFDELSGKRQPGNRVRLEDMNILYAWFICMYLMERYENATNHAQANSARSFLLAASEAYNCRNMTQHVNYETMFLSRYRRYRDGRLSWPMVLGLVTANNLKQGIEKKQEDVDQVLAKHVGTYRGRYSRKNALALGISSFLLATLIAAVAVSIALGGSNGAIGAVAGVGLVVYCGALEVVSFFLMGTGNPLDMLKPDTRLTPPLKTLEEATSVLMSEFSTKHFKGTGLEFTGLVYRGQVGFSYQFSYQQLFSIGFQRLCDRSGREHLLVPGGNEDIVVRLDDEDNDGYDHFRTAELPSNQRFDKIWVSDRGGPGRYDDLQNNSLENNLSGCVTHEEHPKLSYETTNTTMEDVELSA